MDSETLAEMYETIADQGINLHSLIVIRNGYIVSEAYFYPYSVDTSHDIASVTKSVTGTLIGIAVQQDVLKSIDERVLDFFPGRYVNNRDAAKEALTLRHLLTLETGFECDLGATEAGMQQSGNWTAYLLNLPMADKPGRQWYYCSPATHLLSVVLEPATGMSTREYANTVLFGPLGIDPVTPDQWSADPQGVSRGDIGLQLTSRDMAKLGLLYLQDGVWDGTRLLPSGWVSAASAQQADKGDGTSYGYLWTTYPGQSHYAALGMGGQQLHIFPDKNMVVAVTAALPVYAESEEINDLLNDYILPAAKSAEPLPANPDAAARLAALQERLTEPASSPLIATGSAQLISGQTYVFEDNPLGWMTMLFVFPDDEPVALITLNGETEYLLGLDGRYRITEVSGASPIALRAVWVDDSTLEVQQLDVGTTREYRLTLAFDTAEIQTRAVETVFHSLDAEFRAAMQK
jgi:CubicO group peptidase (beta-lactamase class C family)